MTDREVIMQQALTALVAAIDYTDNEAFSTSATRECAAAISELRYAIAQPEQPAVPEFFRGNWPMPDAAIAQTAPVRQPLTTEEISDVFRESAGYGGDDFQSFARAIEAKITGGLA